MNKSLGLGWAAISKGDCLSLIKSNARTTIAWFAESNEQIQKCSVWLWLVTMHSTSAVGGAPEIRVQEIKLNKSNKIQSITHLTTDRNNKR